MDSNVIIDFCNGKLSANGKKFLEKIDPEISIITHIELFATKNISPNEYDLLGKFVEISVIHPVNSDLVKCTIDIRQKYKLKLPDAIIAAIAMVLNLVLLSRNISDFKNIAGLQITNLYSL